MFGKYFTYDGKSSSDYHMMIIGFSSSTDVPMALNRDVFAGTLNRTRSKVYSMGASYADVLTFKISFMKDPCFYTKTEDSIFTEDEVDEINAWLTSPEYPLLFHMYDDDEEDNKKYDYFGIFNNVEVESFGETIMGLTYTFTTNSPFAWTSPIVKTFTCNNTTNLSIDVRTSDRMKPVYPVITITPSYGGSVGRKTISIKNNVDGNTFAMTVLKENIVIDCQKCMISDDVGLLSFDDLGIGDTDYIYWPKLYNGRNNWTVNGDCTIKVEYREPRKVGAY